MDRTACAALLLFVGCGAPAEKEGEPDAASRPDARPRPDAMKLPPDCVPASNFADQGQISGTVVEGPMENYLSIDNVVDDGPPPDLFVVELFRGSAPFSDEITTGEFEISGAQTDYNTCGTCITVFADAPANEAPKMVYIAQSGQLQVESVDINFKGSFQAGSQGAVMKGQRYNSTTEKWEDVPGCEIRGGGANWDKTIHPDIGP